MEVAASTITRFPKAEAPPDEKGRFDLRAAEPQLLACAVHGQFAERLAALGKTLVVTREYEHFVAFLSAKGGQVRQTTWCLPQPTGIARDPRTGAIVVCSTGAPNALIWADEGGHSSWEWAPFGFTEPKEGSSVPAALHLRKAVYLPRTAYIHDIVFTAAGLVGTVTGHNFVGVFDEDGGLSPVWSPAVLDALGESAYRENIIQLNSMAAGDDLSSSFFTAFALGLEPKCWKQNGGPIGRGVLLSGLTREPIARGLTCPHSARLHAGRLWVCDSGRGTVGHIENHLSQDCGSTRFVQIGRAPGFLRGLVVTDDLILVGLSRVLPDYSGYAPGVDPASSRCGVWMFCARTGAALGGINWEHGDQVYDLQLI